MRSRRFRKRNAGDKVPAGKIGLRQWWVVLAAVMGLTEIVFGVGTLIFDPKAEIGPFVLAALGGFGLLTLAGTWFRSRSRRGGDWMIVVGVLPFLPLFWLILPTLFAIAVMVMALSDSAQTPKVQTT